MTDLTPGIDPIRLEVIRNALVAASEEMSITIWRTSRSTVVREILDFSTAVFDAQGNNIAQSARIPVHLNSMSDCLRTILDRFIPLEEWQDGDVIVTNDPYSGGQHLSDIQTFRPVFVDGRRVAIVGTLCHHVDVGGGAAGSFFAAATEVFQEGIRIPPLRLAEKGVIPPADALGAVAGGSASALQSGPPTGPLYEQAKAVRKRAAWSDLRKGIVMGAIGLGLVFYSMLDDGSPNGLGLVLLFVGLGYIVLWYFEERQADRTGLPPSPPPA